VVGLCGFCCWHGKCKKKADPVPIDPAAMYESLKNRIVALEEEEVVEEEERCLGERINASLVLCLFAVPPVSSFTFCAIAEEAQKHVRGLEENEVHVSTSNWYAGLGSWARPPGGETGPGTCTAMCRGLVDWSGIGLIGQFWSSRRPWG
jgi:hypothetical protein